MSIFSQGPDYSVLSFSRLFLDCFNPECHRSSVSPKAFCWGDTPPISLLVIFAEGDRARLLREKALEREETWWPGSAKEQLVGFSAFPQL